MTRTVSPLSQRASGDAPATDLYATDFHAWTVAQALLLRAGNLQGADLANIVEEIETSGRQERSSLRSAYRLIAMHLLKLAAQKERTSRSWIGTIVRERNRAAGILEDNPSLKPQRAELFAAAYRDARREAQAETGLPASAFPINPPFTLAEVEDQDHRPWA